jgi:hypothetical protein
MELLRGHGEDVPKKSLCPMWIVPNSKNSVKPTILNFPTNQLGCCSPGGDSI